MELKTNFDNFYSSLESDFSNSFKSQKVNEKFFFDAYKIVCVFNAWSHYIVRPKNLGEVELFFYEAQNDILTSLTLASVGSWRPALNSIRSFIENILVYLYYLDHSVEFKLWEQGSHRMSRVELVTYLKSYPDLGKYFEKDLSTISNEYKELSKSIHASAKSFKMIKTKHEFPVIFNPQKAQLSMWYKRFYECSRSINNLLIVYYHGEIQGAKSKLLRESFKQAFKIPKDFSTKVKDDFMINLS